MKTKITIAALTLIASLPAHAYPLQKVSGWQDFHLDMPETRVIALARQHHFHAIHRQSYSNGGDGLYAEYALSGYRMAGVRFEVQPQIQESSRRLIAVLLTHTAVSSKQSPACHHDYDAVASALTRLYGPPTSNTQDGSFRQAYWLPNDGGALTLDCMFYLPLESGAPRFKDTLIVQFRKHLPLNN